MRILHTADWHLGQLFHGYDRTYEHAQFLDWLAQALREHEVDVLLISGDVFDFANPPAASVTLFYRFLRKAIDACPHLQIVITAGNHDSAYRLESPKPLLVDGPIHIVGVIERLETGEIDYDKLVIPLKDRTGLVRTWCMAVPYLRLGDHPGVKDCENPYTQGVEELYKQLYRHVKQRQQPGQTIVAMGHLHALHCEVSDADNLERAVLGGLEGIAPHAFHDDIQYVALGHIHKAQRIGGREHIRYCGSPLPMSFSEHGYRHQALLLELPENGDRRIASLDIPTAIRLIKIPHKPKPPAEVLAELMALENAAGRPREAAPYLQVQVLLERPEPALRHQIEQALEGKWARLCKVQAFYPQTDQDEKIELRKGRLTELRPLQILHTIYESKFKNPLPVNLEILFRETEAEAYGEETK